MERERRAAARLVRRFARAADADGRSIVARTYRLDGGHGMHLYVPGDDATYARLARELTRRRWTHIALDLNTSRVTTSAHEYNAAYSRVGVLGATEHEAETIEELTGEIETIDDDKVTGETKAIDETIGLIARRSTARPSGTGESYVDPTRWRRALAALDRAGARDLAARLRAGFSRADRRADGYCANGPLLDLVAAVRTTRR